jgi:hypothetical protein
MCVNLCVEAGYWNIKGCGHFVVRLCANGLRYAGLQRAAFSAVWYHCGTTSERMSFHG